MQKVTLFCESLIFMLVMQKINMSLYRPVGSHAAWWWSLHQKSAGREKKEEGRKKDEREKREGKREKERR